MKKHRMFSVLVILVLMFNGVAVALAHGGDINLIHACANKANGNLRLIGANDSCNQNEIAVDWGIVGPAGPQGEPGPAGQQGDPGISGYEVVSTSASFSGLVVVSRRIFPHSIGIQCPEGKHVLGGGGSRSFGDDMEQSGWFLIESGPYEENTGWKVSYLPDTSGDFEESVTLRVWAICAFVQ